MSPTKKYHDIGITTGDKFKDKMNLLKKKKPDLKNDNFKIKAQRKMNLENKGSIERARDYNDRRKIQRQNESREEKKARLEKRQLQRKSAKKNESLEQREHKLAKIKEYNNRRKMKRLNESPASSRLAYSCMYIYLNN